MKKIILLLGIILISINSFGQLGKGDLKEYVKRISGTFSTLEQHKEDSTFDDVTVHTKLIRKDKNGIYWVYTEQGETKNYAPYRQRVYQIALVDDYIKLRIYYLNDISKHSYFKAETIKNIEIGDIKLKPGCDLVIVSKGDGVYGGQTNDKSCIATFRGSTYNTTDFEVHKEYVKSWERGWNDKGEQVWGSRRGYYIYKKILNK
jgi:hypothetical protein